VPVSEYGTYLENEQGPWIDEREKREEEAKRPEDDEEPKEDFSALKDALSGLKLGGAIGGGKSQQNKIESNTTIPADTPLNTQIDGDDDNH